MVLAGIVLYNPCIERLRENINTVYSQVSIILLVDNGSSNISEIKNLINDFSRISVIYNKKNEGIAYALNQIFEYADRNSYYYVLTLDQDSVVSKFIVQEYLKWYEKKKNPISMLTCRIEDRNFTTKDNKNTQGYTEVATAITSGSMTTVKAWKMTGKFDQRMFIDFVDIDFCFRLKKKGGSIIRANETFIIHELGHSQKIYPFGIPQLIYNHSAFRYYYLIRNRIYYGRKNLKGFDYYRNLCAVIWRFLLITLYEKQKKDKFVSMIRGFRDGFKMEVR